MNEFELFDELTFIDDDLILEAHEKPASRPLLLLGSLRKIAVLAAAVMLLVVSAVATGGDFGISRPKGWISGNSSTCYDFDNENQTMIAYDEGIYSVEGKDELPAKSITKAHATQLLTETECQGEQIQIIQEAMILMDDGHAEYKAQVTEGADQVIAIMDNLVDGEVGEICNVRCTVAILTEETKLKYNRQSTPGPDGKVWVLLQSWNAFLPTQLSYDYPIGVDFRFPDMQYNYDGRNSAVDTGN